MVMCTNHMQFLEINYNYESSAFKEEFLVVFPPHQNNSHYYKQ